MIISEIKYLKWLVRKKTRCQNIMENNCEVILQIYKLKKTQLDRSKKI